MLTVLKIAGLSALLSAALVTAFEGRSAARTTESVKTYQDRVEADLPAHVAARVASVRLADLSGQVPGPDINRAAKGDVPKAATTDRCAGQAWPHLPRDCMAPAEGAPIRKAVRVISLETRDGVAASSVAKADLRR